MANTSSPRPHPVYSLLAILTVCYGVAFLGSIATNSAIGFWYIALNKPTWNPPNWLFAPAWTILYGLMGWASWIVWSASLETGRGRGRILAMSLFAIQLALNCLWSWIFFGWHQLAGGFFEVCVLWVAILSTILAFWRIQPKAGALLLPYLAWVTFAAALNFAIWQLNRA